MKILSPEQKYQNQIIRNYAKQGTILKPIKVICFNAMAMTEPWLKPTLLKQYYGLYDCTNNDNMLYFIIYDEDNSLWFTNDEFHRSFKVLK